MQLTPFLPQSSAASLLPENAGSDEGEHALAPCQRLRLATEAVDANAEAHVRPGQPLTVKPRSSNHSQISGTRSGAARLLVQITVPPALHSWQHAPTVHSTSPRVILPNTPQASTRSAGAMSW